MRILYVSHYFLPYSVGGTEESTYLLARGMGERGHDVHVFHGVIESGRPEHEVHEHVYEGLDCTCVAVDLATIDDFRGTYRQVEVERIFARLIDTWHPDLVHVQHLTRLSIDIVHVAKSRGIPVVLSLHDYWMQCALGQRIHPTGEVCHEIDEDRCGACMASHIDYLDTRKPAGEFRRLSGPSRHALKIRERRRDMLGVLAAADVVLTASRFTAREFERYGVEREIRVVEYGTELADRDGFDRAPFERLRFGFVGRLAPRKGLEVLLDAFAGVAGAELVIHGGGDADYVAGLERAAPKAVRFAGAFERPDLARVYATFDVQVVPSTWYECSPLVIQTARLFEAPLVVSRLGALPELAPEDGGGVHVEPENAADLAAALNALVADPERVTAARGALSPPRSLASYLDEIEALYGSCVFADTSR